MEAAGKTAERNPRGQGDLLRDRLIDAALALLNDGHEPSGISIRGVTRQAGVSPTAFYLHFDSRRQLMRALVERTFSDFRRRIAEGSGAGGDPLERLIGAGVAYIGFARDEPERYRLIFASDWDEEGIKEDPEDTVEVADAAFADLVGLIAGCMDPDETDPVELDTIALGMWSGLHGYATLCHLSPGLAALSDRQYASLLAGAWLGRASGA